MTSDRELMQMALDALLNAQEFVSDAFGMDEPYGEEIEALRDRLAQPEQEPVAWMYVNDDGDCEQIEYGKPFDDPSVTPLYPAPLQREFIGLTTEEIADLYLTVNGEREWAIGGMGDAVPFTRAIEAKLKEKNQ